MIELAKTGVWSYYTTLNARFPARQLPLLFEIAWLTGGMLPGKRSDRHNILKIACERLLTKAGFTAATAQDGEAALRLAWETLSEN